MRPLVDSRTTGQADRRAQWKADCILRRYDNFALMRLNAPISDGCAAAPLWLARGAESAWGVGGRGNGQWVARTLLRMQMLFGCLRRIVHFNMARWVAKLTRKFRCMQISRLQQQRGKWVARGGEAGGGEGSQLWRKSVLSSNKRSLQSCCE